MNTLVDQQAAKAGRYGAVAGTTVDIGEIQSLSRELFTSGSDKMSATMTGAVLARALACSQVA